MYYVFLAQGFEQLEALAPVDIMRRAEIEVYTVGVGGKVVTSSHNTPVVADVMDSETCPDRDCEGIILPGGMPGTLNLEKSPVVQQFIDYCAENGKLIAAICAAPSVLGHKGLLNGKKAVCFPGFEEQLSGADIQSSAVVTDGNIITGKGPAAAIDFGLEVLKNLKGPQAVEEVKKGMYYK